MLPQFDSSKGSISKENFENALENKLIIKGRGGEEGVVGERNLLAIENYNFQNYNFA